MASATPDQTQVIQSEIEELQARLRVLTEKMNNINTNNNNSSSSHSNIDLNGRTETTTSNRPESEQPVGNETTDVERARAESANRAITVNDCRFYHAFIVFAPEDWPFVRDWILPLEQSHGFKFMILERDLLPGTSLHETTAEVIEELCVRVLVILSKNFSESPACKFQTEFAHCLSLDAQNRRLLPILTEAVPVEKQPKVLRTLTMCKMTTEYGMTNLIESLGRTVEVADSDVTHRHRLQGTVLHANGGLFVSDMERNAGGGRTAPGGISVDSFPAHTADGMAHNSELLMPLVLERESSISVQRGRQLKEMTGAYEPFSEASCFRDGGNVGTEDTVVDDIYESVASSSVLTVESDAVNARQDSSDSVYFADVSENSGNSQEPTSRLSERKAANLWQRLKKKVKKMVKK